MLKRNSNFTLIELIVVIVVLGILAAIVIPNISSFQDEARQVQLTADARNVQTALDMFQAKSDSGTEQPVFFGAEGAEVKYTVTASHEEGTNAAGDLAYTELEGGDVKLELINFADLQPDFLRKTPKYVKNAEVVEKATVGATGGEIVAADFTAAAVDYNKGQVVAAVLLNDQGKSTSVVNFVASVTEGIAIVR